MQATENTFEIPSYIDNTAFSAFMDYESIEDAGEAIERFEECYAGTFASVQEWAEQFLDETGEINEIPERLRYYFDYEAFARDCELGGDIWKIETSSGVAIFWSR